MTGTSIFDLRPGDTVDWRSQRAKVIEFYDETDATPALPLRRRIVAVDLQIGDAAPFRVSFTQEEWDRPDDPKEGPLEGKTLKRLSRGKG